MKKSLISKREIRLFLREDKILYSRYNFQPKLVFS